MMLFVNSIITFFISFLTILICVGISNNSSFLFFKINNVIKYYLLKNKKLFLVFNKFNNIYLSIRFNFLSIYFRYEIFIKIFLYYFVYFTLYWFLIHFFSVSKIHNMNYPFLTFYVQHFDLYQSDFSLKYLLNIVNNIFNNVEKNIISNQIDIHTNIFNVFFGKHDDLSDETNTKLLIQTIIQNEDLKEAIYFLPSATQEEICSGDMYRLNKDFIIEKNYEFKVITKKKILSNNELFRWKVLYRHIDEIYLGVHDQKNMNLDLSQVKKQVQETNNKHIHDLFKTITNNYENYHFQIFLKKINIDSETLTIEQRNHLMKEFKNELNYIFNFNGNNEEKTKKICEMSNIKYQNVEQIEKQNPVKIKILEIDTSNEKIKKCHLINKSGIVFNNHQLSNKLCFDAVHKFINKIK